MTGITESVPTFTDIGLKSGVWDSVTAVKRDLNVRLSVTDCENKPLEKCDLKKQTKKGGQFRRFPLKT